MAMIAWPGITPKRPGTQWLRACSTAGVLYPCFSHILAMPHLSKTDGGTAQLGHHAQAQVSLVLLPLLPAVLQEFAYQKSPGGQCSHVGGIESAYQHVMPARLL